MIVNGVHFPVIQVLETPRGTPEYEEKRAALLQAFWEPVPKAYYLPANIIRDPPKDVSVIPSTCGILTPEEIAITENYDCTGLAQAIATKKYTAVASSHSILQTCNHLPSANMLPLPMVYGFGCQASKGIGRLF